MGDVRWQLLSQHLEAMSLVNGEFEDLILLVRQLVQVLESESMSLKTGNSLRQEVEIFSTQVEIANQGVSK